MRRLLIAFLMLAGAAFGQGSAGQADYPGILYVSSAPSGSCAATAPQQNVITLGTIYTCQNGTWAQVAASGTGTVSSCGAAGNAFYSASGTTVSCDTGITDNGSGTFTVGTALVDSGTLAVTGASTFSSNADKVGQASITADSAGINNVETIIVASAATAANRLQAGTVIHLVLWGTDTNTVANSTTFNVYLGTTGTTSDTKIATVTTAASGTTGTNVPFEEEAWITVRTTGSGTSGTADGRWTSFSNNTGIQGGTAFTILTTTMAGFDTTAANKISVSSVTAATTTTNTFKQAIIEIVYK